MKKLLGILVLGLLWCNFALALSLPKDVASGNTYKKSLDKKYKNRFKVVLVPNITNICYGRGVGYKIEEIVLSEEIQKISATKIRKKMREKGKLK